MFYFIFFVSYFYFFYFHFLFLSFLKAFFKIIKMVYFNNLTFTVYKNNILFQDTVIPGSLKITIKPNIDCTELQKISGFYISTSDTTKGKVFNIESNYLIQLKNQLNLSGENSLQRISEFLIQNNITHKFDDDPETDLIQATINSFQIFISLILSVTYLLNNDVVIFEIFNNLKIKLYNNVVDLNICNYNYLQKIVTFSEIYSKIDPENWFIPLVKLCKVFEKVFINGTENQNIIILKDLFTSLGPYFEWKNLEIANTINHNKNLLHYEIDLFTQNYTNCKNRFDELESICNQKIEELTKYYTHQDLNIYNNFENVKNKLTESIQILNKVQLKQVSYNFKPEKTFIDIYDKICEILEKQKEQIIIESISTKDEESKNIKHSITELGLKLDEILMKKSEDKIKIKEEKDPRNLSILETNLRRYERDIESLKNSLSQKNEQCVKINHSKKNLLADIDLNISSKKKDISRCIEKIKFNLNLTNTITKKFEFKNQINIRTCMNVIAEYKEIFQKVLNSFEFQINEDSISYLKKYESMCSNIDKELLILRDGTITFNDIDLYISESEKLDIDINKIFNDLNFMTETHNNNIKKLLQNFYIQNELSTYCVLYEKLKNLNFENIYISESECAKLKSLYEKNSRTLQLRKYMISNIGIYLDLLKSNFQTINISEKKQIPEKKEILEKKEVPEQKKEMNKILNLFDIPRVEIKKKEEPIDDEKILKIVQKYINTDEESKLHNIERINVIEENMEKMEKDMKGLDQKMDKILQLLSSKR